MSPIADSLSFRAHLTRRGLLRATTALAAAAPLAAFARSSAEPTNPLYGWESGTAAGLERWTHRQLSRASEATASIAAVNGSRTIENTLAPYDEARNALAMATNQTQLLASVSPGQNVRDAARKLLEEANAAAVRLDLDPQIHAALLALSAAQGFDRWDTATRHYIEQALMRGRLAGADRDDATRATVQRLQSRISELSARYSVNMYRSTTSIETSVESMKGLPADLIAKHPPDKKGVVRITTAQIDVQPILRFATDAALRRRLHLAYENRAFPENAAVLADLVTARAQLAKTLGYASYADLTLADQMIASASEAAALLDQIDQLSRATAMREVAAVQAFAHGIDPSATVTSADAIFWSERYRRKKFGIDAQEVRAYLPFAQVKAGILAFAARFFGLSFVAVRENVAWHPSVAVLDVHDAAARAKGRLLGRIYLDVHPRPGKDQIFATAPLVPGVGGSQRPEGVIICNLPGGDTGDPGLLTHLDVINLIHEFGHLMHHILAGQGRWSGQGAFDTEEDFLEAPSQMLEEFTRDAAVLQSFTRHHLTGEMLSKEAIDRLNRSTAFGRAGWLRAQLQRSEFALAAHRSAGDEATIEAEHQSTLRSMFSYPPVPGTHAYAASPHLVGYGPNYYMYLLDKVIAVDFARRFPVGDPSVGSAAKAYRKLVLEPGAGRPARSLVRDFLGRVQSMNTLSDWMEGIDGRR